MNKVDIEVFYACHDGVMITDSQGKILNTSLDYEDVYEICASETIGKTVYELEEEGIFKPSLVAKVIEFGVEVTSIQEGKNGQKVVATAVPIYEKSGELKYVVSYLRDITDYLNLKEKYEELQNQLIQYQSELKQLKSVSQPVAEGNSREIRKVMDTINRISQSDANVLITGESGVGKTMYARLIHDKSDRKNRPFVAINCNAIPENLIESELFGYEEGAFTGASKKGKKGVIEQADGGTLFLDEVGDISSNMQIKLLQTIQEKRIIRVGSSLEIKVDFRLIAATNQNLEEAVERGSFRKDLFYRLDVIPLYIPPLRERRDDIFFIAMTLLKKFNQKYQKHKKLSSGVMQKFLNYQWPGNVRELENMLERMVLLSRDDEIGLEDLPSELVNAIAPAVPEKIKSLECTLNQVEEEILSEAYKRSQSVSKVAEELGLSLATASRKLHRYGIIKND